MEVQGYPKPRRSGLLPDIEQTRQWAVGGVLNKMANLNYQINNSTKLYLHTSHSSTQHIYSHAFYMDFVIKR